MDLRDLRRDYRISGLDGADLDPDPIVQFRLWFGEVAEARGAEPNAMILATATADGNPSARTVLLKQFDAAGFVFFSNYESQKGSQLAANPRAELVFYWGELERQVRIHGNTEPVTRSETEAYFRSRPLGSQIGAAVSPQSQVIADRRQLDERYAELLAEYQDKSVPLPENWGGTRVIPETIEFWQGRTSRLHDRLRYRRSAEGGWTIERLAP
jgi:pyridoxamine 5'-phosphate oxidase